MDQASMDAMKRAAAEAALEYVRPGMTVGVGTGSTAAWFVAALARHRDEIVAAVASSEATAAALRAAGIAVVDLAAVGSVPLYVDGADEVDPALRLIKGGGGAHTREKAVATAAGLFVCIVDETKLADRLGGMPVPVEVLPEAAEAVAGRLIALGGTATTRRGFVTDGGNAILDVTGFDLADPERLEVAIDAIPGVVENGIFARRRADVVLVGAQEGVRVLRV
ncbi:MAG TPA: ribose-5-phosphate isomerase RpiA [Thermoleophilia bacterium]|nr:ribose-5-phosphate isomerase RpiA [Thermoleophilia bacterium]